MMQWQRPRHNRSKVLLQIQKKAVQVCTMISWIHMRKMVQPKKTTERKRVKKDKNAPKGARTAYNLFGIDKRPDILVANPGAANTEVTKMLAAAWKQISNEDKAKYDEKAKVDKERHKKETEAYNQSVALAKTAAEASGDADAMVAANTALEGAEANQAALVSMSEIAKKAVAPGFLGGQTALAALPANIEPSV